jgi:hypothetical protein
MWYRVKIENGRRFIDERTKAEFDADGIEYEIETRNKWLEGVVKEFDENYSDGEVLDEVIKLIDEGGCYA